MEHKAKFWSLVCKIPQLIQCPNQRLKDFSTDTKTVQENKQSEARGQIIRNLKLHFMRRVDW